MGDLHKGRAVWTRWRGSPSRIAEIASEACAQARQRDAVAPLAITLEAATWESTYASIDSFRENVRGTDLPDVDEVRIDAGTDGKNRISVTLRRRGKPEQGSSGSNVYARLAVAGSDREWVETATAAMRTVVPEHASDRQYGAGVVGVLVGLGMGVGGLIAAGYLKDTAEQAAKGIAIFGGVVLALSFVLVATIPWFELLPDGRLPRRTRVAQRLRGEAQWAMREAVSGLIGFGLGAGAILIYQAVTG